jgi:prepilin-type N-terminal cleavage/methylation domain-containing protein
VIPRPGAVQRGVTLVELMVVVALLAILAALGVTYWTSPGAGRIARSVQAMATNARRDAIAQGIKSFTAGRPPDRPEPRVPCMPNTQLRITPSQAIQWNCQLNDTAPPQPNQPGCPGTVTDDCNWDTIKAHQLYLPPDMEVAYAQIGSDSRVAPTDGDPAVVYFRPNGSADIHVTGGVQNIGGQNESGTIWVRPVGTGDSECQEVKGRCYKILIRGLMGSAEVINKW